MLKLLQEKELNGEFLAWLLQNCRVCYPWVICILTVRITDSFGLPKPSLFCIVQRDVASLPSYSKLKSNSSHMILI